MATTIPIYGGPTQASISSLPMYGVQGARFRSVFPDSIVNTPWLRVVSDFTARAAISTSKEINAHIELVRSLMTTYTANGQSFWDQGVLINTISPTSLAAAKTHLKFIPGQSSSVTTIFGTEATHSAANGVAFNGTTQGWDLGSMVDLNTNLESIVMVIGRTNTTTISGVPFGGSASFFPRSGGTSGYLSGTLFGTLSAPGLYIGSNDGTYVTIHKDGIRQVPSAETARVFGPLTLRRNFYFGCRNIGSPANFQNERADFIAIFTMMNSIWTDTEIRTLSTIIQTYNTNVF